MLRIPNTFQMEICLPRRHRISCDFASIELPEHKSTHGYITWVDQICKKRKKENTASCWRVRRFVHVGECGEREKKIAKKNRPIQRGAINRDTEKKSHTCVCVWNRREHTDWTTAEWDYCKYPLPLPYCKTYWADASRLCRTQTRTHQNT